MPPRSSAKPRFPKLTEADIERQCSDLLALDGWRTLKTDPVSRREWGKGFGEKGMADCLYLRYDTRPRFLGSNPTPIPGPFPYAEVMWIEWKRPGGVAKPHQRAWIAAERARGALVLLAGADFPATFEGFADWYRGSGLMRRAGLCDVARARQEPKRCPRREDPPAAQPCAPTLPREALAWAYQFVGARGGTKEELDNLSAVLKGAPPPHPWSTVAPKRCPHDRLNEEGYCRQCGADKRGIG